MTQEDKELLLKDLCARLPYEVKGLALGERIDTISILAPTEYPWVRTSSGLSCYLGTGQFKPYLRPMSSMTEEEEMEYNKALAPLSDFMFEQEELFKPIQLYKNIPFELYEFFNSHHFDYRGLIEKGLALEAPEGMYNIR